MDFITFGLVESSKVRFIKLGLPKGIVGFIYGIGVLLAIFTLATRIRSAI